METLDEDSIAITNPAQAEKHYLPKIIAGEMDLTAMKKELREIHNFSEEDIRISARVISSAEFKHKEANPGNYSKWVPVIMSGLIAIVGTLMVVLLWEEGWISFAALGLAGSGVFWFFKAISKLKA